MQGCQLQMTSQAVHLRYSLPPFSVIDVGKSSVSSRSSRPFSDSMTMLQCMEFGIYLLVMPGDPG